MLDTGGGKSGGTWLSIPSYVVDLVGVTLLLEDAVACRIIAVHLMFVVEIGGGDETFSVDGDGIDATGALRDLDTERLLTSAGVPSEDGWLGADLTGDSPFSLGAESDGHDVVSVMFLIVSDVLGGVLDLTTTEEFLGVGSVFKDDSEGGSHVDGVTVAVPVAVLLGVTAAVAIDVLKSVGGVRDIIVLGVVVGWLSDLADPGTDGHELLASGLLDLEEVALLTVVVLAAVAGSSLAGLLVIDDATAVSSHIGIVLEFAWSRCARCSAAHCVLLKGCVKSKKLKIDYKNCEPKRLNTPKNLPDLFQIKFKLDSNRENSNILKHNLNQLQSDSKSGLHDQEGWRQFSRC